MTIDQISEAIGSLRTAISHLSENVTAGRNDIQEIKETLIHGSARMGAIEGRLDELEPKVGTHLAECKSAKDVKLGAKLQNKKVLAALGAILTIMGGTIAKIGIAITGMFGGH